MDYLESIVDRRVREATERGEFDDIPGSGRPLPGRGRPDDPGWWVRAYLARERGRSAAAHQWENIERRVGATWTLASETAVRRHVAELNEGIDEINQALDEPDRRQPLDADAVVATWREMHRARRPR